MFGKYDMKCRIKGNQSLTEYNISVFGYKHAASLVMIAAMSFGIKCILENIPMIRDTYILAEVMKSLGIDYSLGKNSITINSTKCNELVLKREDTEKIHNIMYLLPAMAYQQREMFLPVTGGCQIGSSSINNTRPISHMVSLIEESGGTCELREDGIFVKYHGDIKPVNIDVMDYSTSCTQLTGPHVSGATKIAILLAMNCNETSIIKNPYLKGDVMSLLEFLTKAGYDISYDDVQIIIRNSNKENVKSFTDYRIITDPSTVITLMTLSIYCNTKIVMNNVSTETVYRELKYDLGFLEKIGIAYKFDSNNNLYFYKKGEEIFSSDLEIICGTVLSDHQPFFALLLSCISDNKESHIFDRVWTERFLYANELNKIMDCYEIKNSEVVIKRQKAVSGNVEVQATDLRAAAVLLIAALNRREDTIIDGIEHLIRGYNDILDTIINMNARIEIM